MLCRELEIIPVLSREPCAMTVSRITRRAGIRTAIAFSQLENLFSCFRCRDLGSVKKSPKGALTNITSESTVEIQISGQGSLGVQISGSELIPLASSHL